MKTQTQPIELIEKHLNSPQVLDKFQAILNERARPYVESVFLLVQMREDLQKCSLESIENAALQAASLELSCDPNLKQAHLIPKLIRRKIGDDWRTWWEAEFKPHYLGYYTLAMRTNKYRKLDVIPTPEGYELVHNMETNEDVLLNEKGQPVAFMPTRKNIAKIGGWYGYFVTVNGFTKKVHMTVEEIHAYVKKHNPKGYANPKSLWQNTEHMETMEKKTVLLELLKWAEKTGVSSPALSKALRHTDDAIDVEAEDVEETAEALPSGAEQTVNEAFPNGSQRLMALREKAKADPVTAYWEAAKAAKLSETDAESILGEIKIDDRNEKFRTAFDKVTTAYEPVI